MAPPRRTTRRTVARLVVLPLAVALRYAAGRAPATVDRFYSRGIYPGVARVLGWLTGGVPVSLAEGLLVLAVLVGLALLIHLLVGLRRGRGRRLAILGLASVRVLAAAGWLYLLFLVLWGFNYARLPFAVNAGLDVRPAPLQELVAACQDLVEEANRLRSGLSEDRSGVLAIADGRAGVLRRVTAGHRRVAAAQPAVTGPFAPPKPVLFSPLLSYLGITGVFFPFTGEANVNRTVPAPELPFTAAHELAHQGGVAREDEANYVGYLSCLAHPDQDFQYAGTLAASIYAMNALLLRDRAEWHRIDRARSPAVKRDIQALIAWEVRYQGPAERASSAVNDAYLRSQGQAQGTASYGRMVDLLLAARRAANPGRPTAPGAQ